MRVPIKSAGSKSGVNCILWKPACNDLASVMTDIVLANPGTPSNNTCPLERMPINSLSIKYFWPTITLPTSYMRVFTKSLSCFTLSVIFLTSDSIYPLHHKLSPALSPLTKGDKGGCVFLGNFTTPLPPFLRGILYHPETRINKMKVPMQLNYRLFKIKHALTFMINSIKQKTL